MQVPCKSDEPPLCQDYTKKGTHKAVTYSVISAQEGADGAQQAANFQFSRTDLVNVGGRRAALDDIVKVYTSN